MGKILLRYIAIFIALYLNLTFLTSVSFAANCGDPGLGITYNPDVQDSSPIVNFQLSNPNTFPSSPNGMKQVRLRFGQALSGQVGDTYVPSPAGITINSQTFNFDLSSIPSVPFVGIHLTAIGAHPGELQWAQSAGGTNFEHNSCPITINVHSPATKCHFDSLATQYQPNTPITIQFGGLPNTQYYLAIATQHTAVLGTPITQFDNPSYTAGPVTTNNQGQGVFNDVLLNGGQDSTVYAVVDTQQNINTTLSYSPNGCISPAIALTIAATPAQSKCYAEPPQSSTDNWTVRAINLIPSTGYYATLDSVGAVGPPQTTQASGTAATELTFDLGTRSPTVGPHHVTVNQTIILTEKCFDDFTINSDGTETPSGEEPPAGPVNAPTPSPASNPCTDPSKCSSAGGEKCKTDDPNNPGFNTAIGCIHTSPAEFVKDFMTFIIGLSGGAAFLMMLLGAFGMLTSGGNPETLAEGKDRFTNAIIGLLFVIFAVLLLQIIGVGILNIPGFGK